MLADAELFVFVVCAVHPGHPEGTLSAELFSQLGNRGVQPLAPDAPRRVKVNQDDFVGRSMLLYEAAMEKPKLKLHAHRWQGG